MKSRLQISLSIVLCFTSISLSQQSSSSILNRFVAAFNAHNSAEMLECVSDSIVWFSVGSDSMTIEVKGKTALSKYLAGYFQQCPSCRSEILSTQEAGRFVSIYEKATWRGKTGDRSLRSLGVHEIVNSKIYRVWYYPAE